MKKETDEIPGADSFPKNTPLVTVITLNWNHPQDTLTCLATLSRQDYPHLQLLVVDNGSTDDSVALITAAYPHIKLLPTGQNLGFAGGMNVGLRQGLADGADFLLVLNNDTELAPDMISQLVAAATPEVGLLTPLIYYADEPDIIWSAGSQMNDLLLEQRGDLTGQVDPGRWPAVVDQTFVPACGILLSRPALLEVGLFDERFFMYYEDMDLCLRVRQAGWRLQLVPAAKMWHKVAVSSGGRDSVNERYWMAHSSLIYFRKHARWWQWPFIFSWRMGSALRTSWRLWRRGRPEVVRAYWRGLRDGWRTAAAAGNGSAKEKWDADERG